MRGDARYDIKKSHQTLEEYLKKRKKLKPEPPKESTTLHFVEGPDAFHKALHPPYGGDCK